MMMESGDDDDYQRPEMSSTQIQNNQKRQKVMKVTPAIGMGFTVLAGPILGICYWYFVIYRLFDKTSKFCIVEEGADQPIFYGDELPTDLENATNVSKIIYINLLGIGVSGIMFMFFFIKVSFLKEKG